MANKFVLAFAMVVAVAAVASGLLVAPARRAQIVGGFPIDITEVPYQVSLRKNGRHSCGGSIISPNWILTAAHCLVGVTEDEMSVRAGSTYKEHDGVIRNVVRLVLHPTWDPDTNEGDIALMELESPLPLDGVTMATIEMPEQGEEDPEEGSKAIVSGWGQTLNKHHSNLILRATFVPIVHRNNCQKAYRRLTISHQMLCAGFLFGGHDSCQGDSGGPLVVEDQLVGVVSFAYGCARPGFPGVNARVSAVRDWIREVSNV